MSTLFTRIIQGEIPSYKVAENDQFYAFLDINPLAEGHTLVIPKQEVDYIVDLDDQMHADLWNFAKKIAKAIKEVVPCKKIGFTVIGLEVPHAHIHLIPINTIYDMDFKKEKTPFSPDQLQQTCLKIQAAYAKLG